MTLRAVLLAVIERRQAERRAPAVTTTPEYAERLIAETGYTGTYVTHCQDGVKRFIEFPNPIVIRLERR